MNIVCIYIFFLNNNLYQHVGHVALISEKSCV